MPLFVFGWGEEILVRERERTRTSRPAYLRLTTWLKKLTSGYIVAQHDSLYMELSFHIPLMWDSAECERERERFFLGGSGLGRIHLC